MRQWRRFLTSRGGQPRRGVSQAAPCGNMLEERWLTCTPPAAVQGAAVLVRQPPRCVAPVFMWHGVPGLHRCCGSQVGGRPPRSRRACSHVKCPLGKCVNSPPERELHASARAALRPRFAARQAGSSVSCAASAAQSLMRASAGLSVVSFIKLDVHAVCSWRPSTAAGVRDAVVALLAPVKFRQEVRRVFRIADVHSALH